MQFFFYFHGRDADGTLQVFFQLDAAHGQDHDLQHAMDPALKEWKGAGLRTKAMVSLAVPIGSTIIVGYGNDLSVASGYQGCGRSSLKGSRVPFGRSVTIVTFVG